MTINLEMLVPTDAIAGASLAFFLASCVVWVIYRSIKLLSSLPTGGG